MRLSIKILSSVLTLIAVGMIGNALFTNTQASNALRKSIEKSAATTVKLIADDLSDAIELCRQSIALSSHTTSIQNLFLPTAANSTPVEDQNVVGLRIKYMVETLSYIDYINIISPEGKVIASSITSAVGIDVSDRAYFKAAMQGKKGTEGPLITRTTGNLCYMLAEPIVLNGKIVGVTTGAVNIGAIANEAVGSVKIAGTGYIYFTKEDGKIFAHPDSSNVLSKDFSDTDWFKQAQKNVQGYIEYINPSGVSVFGAYDRVPGTEWIIMGVAPKDDAFAPINSMQFNSIISTLTVLTVIAVVIILLVRSITTDLSRGVRFAEGIADGDLNRQLDIHRNDEIGDLADALRSMVKKLQAMIEKTQKQTKEAEEARSVALIASQEAIEAKHQADIATREGMVVAAKRLEGVVNVISFASEQLAVRVDGSKEGANLTLARVAETKNAMEEMNNTVLKVAQNASETAHVSADAKEKAMSGSKLVDTVISRIGDVEQQSAQLKNDMHQLNSQADAIGTIMNVISDIADQTNLLALNAAIEAARAGDAGRGFAVVADEVRKLAEKTMQATIEVGNAIRNVQRSTDTSSKSVDISVASIAQATELAHKAGDALQEIVHLVDTSADQVNTIATAAEEQSSTAEQINRAMGMVNNASQETAQAMIEAAQAVADLSTQAQHLASIIEELKGK